MADIYDTRRYGTIAFIVIALCVVAVFLYVSDRIVSDLARQEHERMEIWADATKTVIGYDAAVADGDSIARPDMELVLRIIEGNRTIPVLLADDNDVIILHRNFECRAGGLSLWTGLSTPCSARLFWLRSRRSTP